MAPHSSEPSSPRRDFFPIVYNRPISLRKERPVRQPDIIQTITATRPELRKSERKVADTILAKSEDVIHMRIVDLAQAARVSEPTVVRFCRAIGCDGFQNFKVELAQYVANNPRFRHFRLSEQTSAREYSTNVFDAIIDTLKRVREKIDSVAIEAAVQALAGARRVEFYGFGASSPVATDAQHKFFRLQISSAAYSDPHIQAMSALSLGGSDVVVAISQTGRTSALLEAIALAQQGGARVIGLAPGGTPVAQRCNIAIHVDIEEDTDNYTPLPSRIAHLAVIDVLAVGVARALTLTHGASVDEHLRRLNRELELLRS
jgi:RpiR family carbohydrate utilization transcriptional regulator